jgi:hypothetical protein
LILDADQEIKDLDVDQVMMLFGLYRFDHSINHTMKKIAPFIIFLLLFSCQDTTDLRPDSVHKQNILTYLNKTKDLYSGTSVQKIEDLSNAIDFKEIQQYQLRTTEQLLIASAKPLPGLPTSAITKVIFYVNNGEVVRSNIVCFSNSAANADQVILSILNMNEKKESYSGKITFLRATQQLYLFNEYENGELRVNGIARPNLKNLKGGRTNACIDWYLITTYYYPGGHTRTTDQYLFTTCDCGGGGGEEAYRVACQGGGGGSGGAAGSGNGPIMPANPQNNDEYEYTDNTGKYTKYVYNAHSDMWQIVEIVVTPFTIIAEPENYSFLAEIESPLHGQVVVGDDNLLYKYDASTGNWEGEVPSQNKLCGSYIFTETGDGLTAEIITLSAPAFHRPSGQHIPHLWGSACLTFGSSTGLTNSKDASAAFNQAWALTTDEVEVWLNKEKTAPLSVVYSDFFKSTLLSKLAKTVDGAFWFSTGPCFMPGTVPSLTQYCN